ncbi:phospholipase D/nuclease [Calocera viscosa TUFC12733]|uniref:Phospholipase D/nuclease n=1 Tax=Calocera viscosa (strain TUFC12733) TaxID=1330018 RepID=A0A167HE76_CALVF|nr:phospholipase D/nuclease [Calocera viscosa TUFC12733]
MSEAGNQEDEDLKLAIALSLAETSNKPSTYSDCDEVEDAQLHRAIELSKGAPDSKSASKEPQPPLSVISTPSRDASSTAVSLPSTSTARTTSFLGERAALEKERLARQKRQLENTETTAAHASPAKRVRTAPPTLASSSLRVSTSKPASSNVEVFLDGDLRQNRNAHASKNPARSVFGMAEILSPAAELQFVLISAFGTDFKWLTYLIPTGVPLLSVNHPTDSERYESRIKPIGPDGWLYLTPKMKNKGGIMHVKFMMLFYKSGRLRLVIPTANLVPEDWRDIENTVFLQDIPRSKEPPAKPHPFPVYLASFLKLLYVHTGLSALAQGGYPDLPLPSLDVLATRWDWSRVTARLVGSPAGSYEGWDSIRQWGHPRLAEAIRELNANPPKGKTLRMEYQGSSVGNYTTQYLNEFYKSGYGIPPQSWLDTAKSKLKAQAWPPVQIVYPSLQTVDSTILGRLGAGSFFCRKQYWEKANAPKKLFRDSRARSGRVLMHTKMIIGTFVDDENTASASTSQMPMRKGKGTSSAKTKLKVPEPDSDTEPELSEAEDTRQPAGWLYIGSHNFSMAAWGSVSGTVSKPKLWISNFELGIVLPFHDETWLDRVAPWERPAPEYGETDVPWMQEEHLYKLPGMQALLRAAE